MKKLVTTKKQVKFVTLSNGDVKVHIDTDFYKDEFKKIKAIYGIDDMNIALFKSDALQYVLSAAIQGWIDGFDSEDKNDYCMVLDSSKVGGDVFVYSVIDGRPIYEELEDLEDDELQEDNKEDLVEASTDID